MSCWSQTPRDRPGPARPGLVRAAAATGCARVAGRFGSGRCASVRRGGGSHAAADSSHSDCLLDVVCERTLAKGNRQPAHLRTPHFRPPAFLILRSSTQGASRNDAVCQQGHDIILNNKTCDNVSCAPEDAGHTHDGHRETGGPTPADRSGAFSESLLPSQFQAHWMYTYYHCSLWLQSER